MKIRLRILRWLSLLLLSAGIAAGTRMHKAYQCFRRRCKPIKVQKETRQITHIQTDQKMEIRLRILRWLSLLLLSAGLVGWSHRIAEKAGGPYLAHDPPDIYKVKNLPLLANFKQILQTYQRTMEIQLKTLRWLSLLLLSEVLRWEPHNLAHFSWFRRP